MKYIAFLLSKKFWHNSNTQMTPQQKMFSLLVSGRNNGVSSFRLPIKNVWFSLTDIIQKGEEKKGQWLFSPTNKRSAKSAQLPIYPIHSGR
jgi:hypothetical protein